MRLSSMRFIHGQKRRFQTTFYLKKENESKNDDCKLKNSKLRIG